jgi:glycosyltransferase involved in cell wall biosynthesis
MNVIVSAGGRFHAIKLAEQLQKRGHLKRVITTKSWYCRGIIDEGKYRSILMPEIFGLVAGRFSYRAFSFIKDNLFDMLAKRYVDACNIFHGWMQYSLNSLNVAKQYGANIVIDRGAAHPVYQKKILTEEYQRFGINADSLFSKRLIEKALVELVSADAVMIPSEFVLRSFVDQGFDTDKIKLIPYGVDLRDFRQIPKSDSVFRIVFVGNVGFTKGVFYLLEAVSELALKNSELLLVGNVEDCIKPLLSRYKDVFTHRRYVPHADLYRIYSNSSIFVLPSIQEGWGMVTYEAMACGLPVVVSENTGAVIRDGLDGFVVPIRDTEALKEKILFFYENEDKRAEMGINAKEYVQQWTWDRYGQKMVEAYGEILRSRKSV